MSSDSYPPIHTEQYNRVLQRVCYRLIELDHRRNPTRYHYPPSGVLALAQDLRVTSPEVYWTMLAAAKWLANGVGTLREWRGYTYEQQLRALHKRRVSRYTRRR